MIKRGELKQFKLLKRTMMSSGTQERPTKTSADRFRKSHSVEKCAWEDEKDFTVDVPLNSPNSRVY